MPKAEVKTHVEAKKMPKPVEPESRDILEAFVELEVKGPDGTVKERREFKSESFLRQWMEMLYLQFNGGPQWSGVDVRDTGNTVREIVGRALNWRADAGVGVDDYGILIGSGTTAPTLNDYAMETLIVHGVGAGQLQYSDMAIAQPAINLTVSQVTVTRDFANASGGAVTVNEVGLAITGYDATHTTRYILVIRDVIAGGISVPNGDTLTVNYRIQASV